MLRGAEMEITTREFKRCVVVEPSGRIDSATSPQLAEVLDELIGAGECNLVFDMSNVDFISSAGLRVLIDTQKRCRNRGGVILAQVPEPIYEAFDLAGLVAIFSFNDDLLAAVGSF
jgi:anti-sigma B factor antagonist